MQLKFKKIKAITKIAKDRKVVNFSVKKNENYFANGILTHNCYMKRHKSKGLSIADNRSVNNILTEINSHAWFDTTEKPNQTHEKFITYDISCNEDFALHLKYHDWKKIFDFFKSHELAMGSFATKYVNKELLLSKYNPEGKIRIRFSVMPEKIRQVLEPNTSSIFERLHAVRLFQDAGYDVHLNFSPVIVYNDWLQDYKELFLDIHDMSVRQGWHRDYCLYPDRPVKAEVIFLTHNEGKHAYNLANNLPGEDLLWNPSIQEDKISQYGGKNIRYKRKLKAQYIKEWTKLHDEIIPWNTIRYIF
jgi:spore photoproduct lyase